MNFTPYSLLNEIAIFNYHPSFYMHDDWISDFGSDISNWQNSKRYHQIISDRAIHLINGNKNICPNFSNLIRRICFVKNIESISLILGSYILWFAVISSIKKEVVEAWISILGKEEYFNFLGQKENYPVNYKPYLKDIMIAADNLDVNKIKFLLQRCAAGIIRRLLIEEHVGLWERMILKFPKNIISEPLDDFSFYSSYTLRNILFSILDQRAFEWKHLTK